MKKENIKVVEEIKIEKPIADGIELQRLARVVTPTQNDLNSIYSLYKKYINSKAVYSSSCNSCRGGIKLMWSELIEFYGKNKNIFE